MKAIKFITSILFAIGLGSVFAVILSISPIFTIGGLVIASCIIPSQTGIFLETATISVAEIVSEFGTYLGQNIQQIKRLLTQPTISQNFMTTVATKDLVYRASKAVVSDLVQGFQKAWTPKGTPAFTPRSIPQRRHKFDISFYPDEVVDTWLGFLTDEANARAQWPITRYILEQLIIPKINENRELSLIGIGDYEEPSEGVAQDTGKSMDGFCTLLEDLKTAGTSNVNFISLDGGMTYHNVVENIEDFAAMIKPLYLSIGMRLFCSQNIYMAYHRRKRDLYGIMPTYDPKDDVILGTNMILTPLPSMATKDIIFATPKENFIRVLNRNEGASNIMVENVDRQIKIYADWHESVGFGIEEALFAYVPSNEDAGSASI
jgi:hypothetical protein